MLRQMFANMPPVVKNLLILNLLFFIAQLAIPAFMEQLKLYPVLSEDFKPWQLATHFFMHDSHGIFHILFNMFALVMFGRHLETVWGPKRFLTYYFVTAIGAAVLHLGVAYFRFQELASAFTPEEVSQIISEGRELLKGNMNFSDNVLGEMNVLANIPVIGASGAVFGILAAFGYLFPNTELMLLFPPIPIKAKWFVLGYAAIELYLGFANNPHDNVAHWAHLGGALFGIIMVLIWQRNKNQFY